ncbi:hypothetical protein [Nesterenkonia pannonica]|uniref:acyltransferase family protein n=1 Tax=Nesterenkonia pannonica TaxID=1548602 RepID=UPI00216434EA|nr:acyltransferase family protein [Nesterenkonia pannonica]
MTAAGLAAIGLLTFSAWAETPGREPLLTLGGTLVSLLLVGACLIGPAGLSRWGDVSLLGWIGTRSYGLYLWHFPLIVLADHLMAAHRIPLLELLDQYQVRVLAVIVAVAAAEASYRWVEMPVRRHGFGHVLKAPARAAAAGTIVAALVASIAWSQTSSPESTSSRPSSPRARSTPSPLRERTRTACLPRTRRRISTTPSRSRSNEAACFPEARLFRAATTEARRRRLTKSRRPLRRNPTRLMHRGRTRRLRTCSRRSLRPRRARPCRRRQPLAGCRGA